MLTGKQKRNRSGNKKFPPRLPRFALHSMRRLCGATVWNKIHLSWLLSDDWEFFRCRHRTLLGQGVGQGLFKQCFGSFDDGCLSTSFVLMNRMNPRSSAHPIYQIIPAIQSRRSFGVAIINTQEYTLEPGYGGDAVV